MSAQMKTKYTTVEIDSDDDYISKDYFGYISVRCNLNTEEACFFAETMKPEIMWRIRDFFIKIDDLKYKNASFEDNVLLLDIPSADGHIFATDVYRIVKEVEAIFQKRAGL